jgi:hypothetical protein
MEVFKALLIHLVVPLTGLLAYLKICREMHLKSIEHPPYFQIFAVFFGFGGWLLIFLTLVFWYWSGMATLGFFFLLIIMPLIAIGCIISLYENRNLSNYHFYAFRGCLAFLLLELGLWTLLLLNTLTGQK